MKTKVYKPKETNVIKLQVFLAKINNIQNGK
jgi:hypothetical protein